MIMGSNRLEALLHRSAGLNLDKSDVERLTDFMGRKLNDLLVIGVRNASFNNRDIIMEADLPLTKGVREHLDEFQRHEETLNLRPILDQLAAYPPPELSLSQEVEAMLPALMGTLAMLAGRAMKIIDPEVKNPDSDMWERVVHLMDLML
jgi:hypothetical protein